MKLALALVVLIGCSGDTDPPDDAVTPDDSGTTPVLGDVTGLPQGTYLVGLSIAAVGGLVVPLQLDVEAVGTDDGGTEFAKFDLRAVGTDDSVSDILVSFPGVAVTVDGGFVADLPDFVLPAAYSVTSSDVTVNATLTAETVSDTTFCGTVAGTLPTIGDLPLDGSTFGAVQWDTRGDTVPKSCDTGTVEELPRIEDCPALVDGANTGFPSGGLQRSFEVVLPPNYDDTTPYPLVFLFHGFGGSSGDMLASGVIPYANDVILISPQGEDLGDTTGWDAFSDPRTNTDLVLFDDLVTCASESFAVDPERIHVTGMSNGGLMTGYLSANRADVIASIAPMSGGVGVEPVASSHKLPALVIWGGEDDFAYQQDFNVLANQMIDLFLANDQFVVGCDHGLGHTLSPDFWPWVMPFLLEHPRDLASEPYATELPPGFPAYCSIR